MNIKKLTAAVLATATSATLTAAVPEITGVTMAQDSTRLVTINYTLSDAPAVVTLDVQTNSVEGGVENWTSIGGEFVWNAQGDVWRKVGNDLGQGQSFSGAITWRPDHSWPDHKIADGGARAVLTAWALDNTPDYMVVDLAAANTVRYYPAVDFLPGSEFGQKGAVTNNIAYKTTKLLMRKIMAKGVEWTMGSADGETQRRAAREAACVVSLTNNYYIGVFEVTQGQWKNIAVNSNASANFKVDGDVRPMECVCYNEIRNNVSSTAANATFNWPNPPNPNSFLGKLRAKTGLDFDLPIDSQWEFAARAGHGSGYWNNGTAVMNKDEDDNMRGLGRYTKNGGGTSETSTLSPSAGGTAVVGSYAPSDWGLYDMHGNVWEWCLDWYEENLDHKSDAAGEAYGGRVNIDPSSSAKYLSGADVPSTGTRVARSGAWNCAAGHCRSAFRNGLSPTYRGSYNGFRVVCSAGLK